MGKPQFTNREYLRREQYKDASNLNARIEIHRRFSTNSYGWFRWYFEHLQLEAGNRVLDVGCGPAPMWAANQALLPANLRMTLTDLSEGMVAEARERLAGSRAILGFAVADVQALPCPDGAFDAVLANHMLYHVPDRQRALREIRRTLRPGGRFYAATNGESHLSELHHGELAERFGIRWFVGTTEPVRTEGERGFSLENGAEQLTRFFDRVRVERYEDALEITEAEPLIAYILSADTLSAGRVAELRQYLEQQIADRGSIHVTKDTGVFIAE